MRVISRFTDYYDSAAGYDHEASVTYLRETRQEFHTPDIFESGFWSSHFWTAVLGFCGRMYPLALVPKSDVNVRFLAPEHDIKLLCDVHYDWEFYKASGWWDRPAKEFFQRDFSSMASYFLEYKTPVWLTYRVQLPVAKRYQSGVKQIVVINPCLRVLAFQKIVPPYLAHQEIEVYLGNVLTGERNPSVVIEDKYRIEAHGFDKWSFRKHKEQK